MIMLTITPEAEKRIVDAVLLRLGSILMREIKSVVHAPDQPRYASPNAIYITYGIKPFTIRAMVRRGEIKGRTGKPFLVDIPSLEAWIENNNPEATE